MTEATRRHALLELGSALAHEAYGRRGALGPVIRPLWPGARVAGPCQTVRVRPGDNLGIHVAIERAAPEHVLCVAASGGESFGAWGEVVTTFARERGLLGLVTSVGVRDLEAIAGVAFPVFGTGSALQGTAKRDEGDHGVAIRLGSAIVRDGDWIVGDVDGCTVVRAEDLTRVLAAGRAKVEAEARAMDALRRGATTRAALGF